MRSPVCLVFAAVLPAVHALAAEPAAALVPGQWTPERAWTWYQAKPWLVGCNFLPSTAVNDVEMWQAATFDPATIERELGWARDLGFNTLRVFLNFVVWEDDARGLKQRLDAFLAIADRLGISVMPVLFDDCNFAGRVAAIGPQPGPVPGVHNSQWVSSPPLAMVTDCSAWPRLERYVKDMVSTFASARGVVVWDLYNEPGNSGLDARSRPLMEAAFAWARAANPSQPLTVGAWTEFAAPFSRKMMELSDVVSFHGYDTRDGMEAKLARCSEYGRPILCTEWLRRQVDNRFETLLALFRDRRIGAYHWGLVAGRTQTYFPWGSPEGAPEPDLWQHDVLHADGRPYRVREAALIRSVTGRMPAGSSAAQPPPRIVGAGLGLEGVPVASHDWPMGPFLKHPQPVLSPRAESTFRCPVLGREIRWEEQNVYNPAAVVRAGRIHLLYRADDRNPALPWGRTCRIGLAWSEDGTNFTRHPTPVLYPDNDEWKPYEWEGGCEDLHIAEGEDGTCFLNYTTWNGSSDTVSVASSADLVHWTKHGPAFRKAGKTGGRSGVVVSRRSGDRLVAARIDGKYWMYYTHPCAIAWSTNLIDWTPVEKAVWPGGGREAGAIALLRDDGILLMTQGGHPTRGPWTLRQTWVDRRDLAAVLQDQAEPFLWPELEWERNGFTGDTVVANALVPFKGRWWLYYGAADRRIGMAIFSPGTGSPHAFAPAPAGASRPSPE